MLEWYRPHYDMYRLMNEVDDLLQQVLDCQPAESLSYQQAFQRHLEIDPLSADKTQLREAAAKLDLSNIADTEEDRDTLLQLLFTMGVEPHIGKEKPTFIYHFPASQASLAQISTEDHRVAERFEVYYKGIELANGFHELTDAREQQQRLNRTIVSAPRAVCRSSRLTKIYWMRWPPVYRIVPAWRWGLIVW